MDVSRLLDNLNPAQREAVTSDIKSLLVLAGAGSGKTRALVHRIAWLLQVKNLPASSVLAVTFTNKAAKEMRARIAEILQMNPYGMWVGTFHGIAHRLLKAHWQDAGLPQNFQIIDSEDQLRIIKRLMKEYNLDENQWSPKSMQWYINGCKDEGKRPQNIDCGNDPFEKVQLKLYEAYQEACNRSGQVDFGEILLRSHELWLKHPNLLAHYQQRFKHILVDEFQDTNTIQYAWLRVLSGKETDVTVVGDDDQSIYGWRGAKIENIQQFQQDFPDAKLIKLEQNYRSTSNILDAANAVIANNSGRLGKDLWTEEGAGEQILLYSAFNEQDEARFIVERVKHHFEENTNYNEQAILYRSNAQSRVIEEELIRAGIPYRIYGGQRFYDRLEIKNAVAYMRLAFLQQDDAAFERIINTPTRGIGNKSVDEIRQRARAQNVSMWQAAEEIVNQGLLSGRAVNAIKAFFELIDSIKAVIAGLQTEEKTLGELADFVLDATELSQFHAKEPGEKGRARVENLKELVSACNSFEADDKENTLREFLDTAALDAGEQQADDHTDALQLMTLHTAKGLEFPVVYLAGCEENLFPHRMSAEDPAQLQEERRLCYVGITRAMQKLYLTYAECRRLFGQETYNSVSRFIREIPEHCLQEVRMNATVSRASSFTLSAGSVEQNGLSLGQRVMHKVFGEGVILNIEGQGDNARVQVNFDSEGSKWLVAAFANLQTL